MRIDRSYCSNQNTWPENHPQCIVVHNTDNFAAGADARAHARAQYQGNFQNKRRVLDTLRWLKDM